MRDEASAGTKGGPRRLEQVGVEPPADEDRVGRRQRRQVGAAGVADDDVDAASEAEGGCVVADALGAGRVALDAGDGGAVGGEVRSLYQVRDRPNDCSHVFIAIDTSRFDGIDPVAARVDRFAAHIRASERAPGVDAIFAPGDLERAAAVHNRSGLSLSAATVSELRSLAEQAGVASPFDDAAA